MLTIFLHTLNKYRGQILGWGISLALLGGLMLPFYDTLSEQQESMAELIEQYPREIMAFFGNTEDVFTPGGYLHLEFFSYMPLVLGFFSVLTGAALLAGDEESGVLDLVLAHPVSRTRLFLGRLLAYLAANAGILTIAWVGFVAAEAASSINLSPVELALPFLSMLSLLLVFGSLALLFSMVLPSVSTSATLASVLLISSFLLSVMASINSDLEHAARFSPVNYYQGGEAVGGLNWEWFGALMGISLIMILAALVAFNRKDIRVGGEGSLGFGGFLKRRKVEES